MFVDDALDGEGIILKSKKYQYSIAVIKLMLN
jgi:hypothetical protein